MCEINAGSYFILIKILLFLEFIINYFKYLDYIYKYKFGIFIIKNWKKELIWKF